MGAGVGLSQDALQGRATYGLLELGTLAGAGALAYVGPGVSADLWIQSIGGSPPRQLTRFPGDRRQIADFAWSADGKRLAVARAAQSNDIVMFRGFRGAADK